MKRSAGLPTGLRARVEMTGEAVGLSVRCLLDRRLAAVLPIFGILLLISLPSVVLRCLAPRLSPRRDAQVVPFVYPLF